ncbi:signal peptidase I [Bacillus salipaludis]|uniref:Signal peptidase I n=1 Tax=Bacillus salipaludis TaxID=2547811 RepID=A0ABW8RKT4_9BACI
MEKTMNGNFKKNEFNAEVQKKSTLFEWVKFSISLLLIIIIIHNSIGLTTVSGYSMMPTFQDGNLVLEEKVSKYFKDPKIGDVVVINRQEQGYKIIKRILGLPGDTIEIKSGIIYVNQNPIPEITTEGFPPDMQAVRVPKNHIFVIGDNRNPGESIDSRDPSVGPIQTDEIDGYALYSLKPFGSIPKPINLN